jgi:hypothetical protein
MRLRLSRSPVVKILVLLTFFGSACSVEETMPYPDCDRGDSGLIAAQSVPTAELAPCFRGLPNGWDAASVEIDQTGTVIRFDSDRAGSDSAIMRYARACDVGDAVSVPSNELAADRFDFIDQIRPRFKGWSYYVFTGGCLWWEFDFDEGVPVALSIDLTSHFQFISRDVLNQNVADSFIDEEL